MTATAEATWVRGDWMQTYTGRQFFPLAPHHRDVDPVDIAHALSLICRYGGHVDRFYSVAEHCVLMAEYVAPEHKLAALLHDATEAYVGDMVRPLKHQLPSYMEAEDRVAGAIARRFAVPVGIPKEVKDADNRILLTERAALMSNTRHQWIQDGLEPLPVTIHAWSPAEAEDRYLDALSAALAVHQREKCWRHDYGHREYVCTCQVPPVGDTGREA